MTRAEQIEAAARMLLTDTLTSHGGRSVRLRLASALATPPDPAPADAFPEAVRAAAFGAAFASAMHRGCHGQARRTPDGEEVIDARPMAREWATTCADAAVASLVVPVKPEGSEAK